MPQGILIADSLAKDCVVGWATKVTMIVWAYTYATLYAKHEKVPEFITVDTVDTVVGDS